MAASSIEQEQGAMADGTERVELNKFQTVRTINTHPGAEQFARDRAIVAGHVGRYVVDWAHLDYTLNMIAAMWNGTAKSDLQYRKMAALRFAVKLGILKTKFIGDWLDGQALLEALAIANAYRNSLTHWTLGYSGHSEEGPLGWHLHDPQAGFLVKIRHLNTKTMQDAETTIDILDKALSSLAGPPYWDDRGQRVELTADQLNAHSIARVVIDAPGTWDTVADLKRFRAMAHEIFSAKDSQGRASS